MAVIVRVGITILEKGVGAPSGNRLTGESWRHLVSPDCKKPWMPSHLRMDFLQWAEEVWRRRGKDIKKAGKLYLLVKRYISCFPFWH